MSDSGSAATPRVWVVTRSETRTQFYVGIEAETRGEAIAAFYRGEGELDQDATDWSEATVTARRVCGASKS